MPTSTFTTLSDRFPVGQSVGAYKRSNWGPGAAPTAGTAPVGSADATGTVASDGSLQLTSLAGNTDYVLSGNVSGVGWVHVGHRAPASTGKGRDTLLPSAARTTSVQTATQTAPDSARGVLVTVDVTAVSGTTPTLSPRIEALDAASAKWVALNALPTNITATGTYTFLLYPAASGGAATQVTPFGMPDQWRVNLTVGGTTPSFTFTVGVTYLP